MQKVEISVIVCTYNRAKYINQLLESIACQDFPKERYEIIFINNNSTDQTETICNKFKERNQSIDFKYFNETQQGLSFARNRGIKEANGKLVAFIDDDAVAHTGYLKQISASFAENPAIDASGGKIVPLYETTPPKWMNKFLAPVMSVIDLGENVKEFPKNKFPIGANMIFRKSVFDKVGDFNTKLGRTGKNMLGGEEKDIFFRMKKHDLNIYWLPQIVVSHSVPDTRLQESFIKKQAIGIGQSEVIRTKYLKQSAFSKAVIREAFKWGASFVLFAFYGLSLQWAKARMIILFRYWVTKGMIQQNSSK